MSCRCATLQMGLARLILSCYCMICSSALLFAIFSEIRYRIIPHHANHSLADSLRSAGKDASMIGFERWGCTRIYLPYWLKSEILRTVPHWSSLEHGFVSHWLSEQQVGIAGGLSGYPL